MQRHGEYAWIILQGCPTSHAYNPVQIYNSNDKNTGTNDGNGTNQGSDSHMTKINNQKKLQHKTQQ